LSTLAVTSLTVDEPLHITCGATRNATSCMARCRCFPWQA
jgi:hypothetical protein